VPSLSEIDPALIRARELTLKNLPPGPALWVKPPGDTEPRDEDSRFYHPWFPEHQRLLKLGWKPFDEDQKWETVVLFGGRQKEENRRLLAVCRALSTGAVYFVLPNDYGAKSFKSKIVGLREEFVGRKCRLFVVEGGGESVFELESTEQNSAGFQSTPGLFSWDKVDHGSRLLSQVLNEERLRSPVVDLGAGWGYLAAGLPPELEVHLVEADRRGLEAAKVNLSGRTCHFHWADATVTSSLPQNLKGRVPTVIANPPFHTHKKADPVLGGAFVATAAWLLKRGGSCYLVGNAHLPYKTIMSQFFSKVDMLLQRDGFQVLRGKHDPSR
jgi:16S rRNA (guanine1207-N2)-methyltransferase